ATTNV
ncbi:hypothetical protein D049_0307B, partial [Vibrio parahaemolyticus VPTS-2010]